MSTFPRLGSLFVLLFVSTIVSANTWNEPWHEDVLRHADTFGLYRVESVQGRSASLILLKHLAGQKTSEKLTTSGYSMLHVTSASSNDWDVGLTPGESYYLFLTSAPGGWQLPTPSAGSDPLRDSDMVEATFRISMHKALVPKGVYELTQVCMFATFHNGQCNESELHAFIADTLSKPVATLSATTEGESARFFLQHAALETAATMRIAVSESDLKRFDDSQFFHVQLSVLRYVASMPGDDKWRRISAFVCDSSRTSIARRYAVMLLGDGNARSQIDAIRNCVTDEPENESSLTTLMDPRIGTRFPEHLKEAVDALVKSWSAP